MRNIRYFSQFIGSVLLLCLFLCTANIASAETLWVSGPLVHEGLTISQPLMFSSDTQSSLPPITLQFGTDEPTKDTISITPEHILLPSAPIKQTPIVLPSAPSSTSAVISTPPIATPTPTQSLPIISPTTTPTPPVIPTTISSPTPTSLPKAVSGGLDAEKLFAMSNAYRATKGLPPLQKDDRSCQLAQSRAPEIANEVATATMHKGLRDRNLTYWNTENIISMRTEEEAFNWWINDTIHREAIEGNYTYSCVACSGNSCAQEFTNFQAK